MTTNKNAIPYDTEKPWITGGLQVGAPAVTTRGFKEAEMDTVAGLIAKTLTNIGSDAAYDAVRAEVKLLSDRFPG